VKCICIIPARGGSKRVENKNLCVVDGKTLIQHAIDLAFESSIFDNVIVNSEDERIL
jgi:CMP-N-acetylneuraminic acid synthetase